MIFNVPSGVLSFFSKPHKLTNLLKNSWLFAVCSRTVNFFLTNNNTSFYYSLNIVKKVSGGRRSHFFNRIYPNACLKVVFRLVLYPREKKGGSPVVHYGSLGSVFSVSHSYNTHIELRTSLHALSHSTIAVEANIWRTSDIVFPPSLHVPANRGGAFLCVGAKPACASVVVPEMSLHPSSFFQCSNKTCFLWFL